MEQVKPLSVYVLCVRNWSSTLKVRFGWCPHLKVDKSQFTLAVPSGHKITRSDPKLGFMLTSLLALCLELSAYSCIAQMLYRVNGLFFFAVGLYHTRETATGEVAS